MVKKLVQTDDSADRFSDIQARVKLGVPEDSAIAPPRGGSLTRYSQYASVRPGAYTGLMRELVQLLLGVGIVFHTTYERRWIKEDTENRAPIKQAVEPGDEEDDTLPDLPTSAFGLYGGDINEPVGVRVAYDYRSNRTHGLVRGAGTAYLVEISQRGVLFMKLPVDPVSEHEKGRARYAELYPEFDEQGDDGLSPLERYGGFPTGESFPGTTKKLEAAIRAGEVVRALDSEGVKAFYEKIPYTSALGWAFNRSGTRADNTCYEYEGDLMRGHHYSITLTPGAYEEPEPSPAAEQLIAALRLEGWEARKAKRLDGQVITRIMSSDDIEDAFDRAEAQAPFTATAALAPGRNGILYHPGRAVPRECYQFSGQPQIKLPEPLWPGCLSFDFSPLNKATRYDGRCDTPMVVMWDGDRLITINYFWEPPEEVEPPISGSTRGECQWEGEWEHYTYMAFTHLRGNFYTTDIDLRKELRLGFYHLITTTEIGRAHV
jgi:hypothetical protein